MPELSVSVQGTFFFSFNVAWRTRCASSRHVAVSRELLPLAILLLLLTDLEKPAKAETRGTVRP